MRVILLLLFLGLGVPVRAQDLGSLIYKATSTDAIGPRGRIQVYNHSYAVVIGISDYQSLPDLPGAVPDAKHVAEALEKEHKFDVRLLLNRDATRTRTTTELGDRLIPVLKYGDRVLDYFAGHGVTVGEGDQRR